MASRQRKFAPVHSRRKTIFRRQSQIVLVLLEALYMAALVLLAPLSKNSAEAAMSAWTEVCSAPPFLGRLMSCLYYVLLILAAYYAADLFVGLYHMLTDKGWNIQQQVIAFREHHDGAVVFDLKPVFFALPVIAVGVYFWLPFVIAFASFASLAEFAHYASHRPASCPGIVRKLQQFGVINSPAAHAKHHDGVFHTSYCVFTGWANPVVDLIARYVPTRG
jgi:hypothetical protein